VRSVSNRQRLEQDTGDFDLKLVFAEPDGHYLADVPVAIEDSHGDAVLRATSQGPWFYAELPLGHYYTVMYRKRHSSIGVR
jgi:hypothetical protein